MHPSADIVLCVCWRGRPLASCHFSQRIEQLCVPKTLRRSGVLTTQSSEAQRHPRRAFRPRTEHVCWQDRRIVESSLRPTNHCSRAFLSRQETQPRCDAVGWLAALAASSVRNRMARGWTGGCSEVVMRLLRLFPEPHATSHIRRTVHSRIQNFELGEAWSWDHGREQFCDEPPGTLLRTSRTRTARN